MATFAEIKEVRLKINDPDGYIDILEITSFPASAVPQTAYKKSGIYYGTDEEDPSASDWYIVELYVSDSRLSGWIDADSEEYASVMALKQIIAHLGKELRIKRSDSGAESTEWVSLKEAYEYYKALLQGFKDDYNDSKRKSGPVWGQSDQPEIAGGNI